MTTPSRESFERWAADKFAPGRFSIAKHKGDYIDDDVSRFWLAYCSGHAEGSKGKAEVVEALGFLVEQCDSKTCSVDGVEIALESARLILTTLKGDQG